MLSSLFILHAYPNIMGLPIISKDKAIEIVNERIYNTPYYPSESYFIRTNLGYVNIHNNDFSSGVQTLFKLDPNTGLPVDLFSLITSPFRSEFNGGSFYFAWTVSFIQCTDQSCEKCYPSTFYHVDVFTGEIVYLGTVIGALFGPCERFGINY